MKTVLYIGRALLLFVFAFALSRLIFVCYFYPHFSQEPVGHILQSFYYALKIDIATSCYLLLFPTLIFLIECLFNSEKLVWARRIYVLFILFANAMVTSADLGLYQEWGVKMNYRALLYLGQPSEVLSTASIHQLLLFVLFTIFQTALTWHAYFKSIKPYEIGQKNNRMPAFAGAILIVPFLILGIRGGWQEIPIQVSDSYYSTNADLNWAAVNSLWNVGQSVHTGLQYGLENPYPFYEKNLADKTVRSLYADTKGPGIIFLNHRRPNIVFIIFEGWSADLIYSISQDQEHSCTPHFDSLAAQGLLFTNCIASGERSDQGLAAILSSFPSLPLSSIVNYPEKVDQLPSLLKPFKQQGYHSLFLFGGQLSYGNLKALIYHNGFDKVIEEKDIDSKIYRGRLGVHDEHTFDILSHELNSIKQPFVAGFFTQSTHFSYDYPKGKKPLRWAGIESGYANSMMYADSCLGDFFVKAKRQAWYANTLFVMVSDHSHVMPWNDDHKKVALHRIPLLLYGDVVKTEFRGMKRDAVVSQQDICATLLVQLHLPHDNFKWSKDIMDPAMHPFAYWTFTEGFGFTQSANCEFVYDLAGKKVLSQAAGACDSSSIKQEGLSYLQMLFEDFISTGRR